MQKQTQKKDGLLIYHQGWTDIINCLALINYYSKRHKTLYVYMRNEAKQLVDFYIKTLNNVIILYDKIGIKGIYKHLLNKYPHLSLFKAIPLGIGYDDNIRTDKHKNKFATHNKNVKCFVKKFYVSYDIPYKTRITNFNIERDYELENKRYIKFIEKHGTNYVLCHKTIDDYNQLQKAKVQINNSDIKIDVQNVPVELGETSNIFFDMIKVLENAKEIHVLDSVWASIIYHLDGRYKLLTNIPIYLYAKRDYTAMFSEPVRLNNWKFI
jgi:hypothetical protein